MDHFYDMPKGGVYDIPDPGFLPPLWPWFQSVINVGGHGVELFFMISGFLIPASLVRHGSLARFFFDRVLRIMPVFLVLHVALFVIGPIVGYKFFRGIDVGSYLGIYFYLRVIRTMFMSGDVAVAGQRAPDRWSFSASAVCLAAAVAMSVFPGWFIGAL